MDHQEVLEVLEVQVQVDQVDRLVILMVVLDQVVQQDQQDQLVVQVQVVRQVVQEVLVHQDKMEILEVLLLNILLMETHKQIVIQEQESLD